MASEPELTFDEIGEALDLSKSATCNALHKLQTIGTVVYRTDPGDRALTQQITVECKGDLLE